MWWAPGHPFHSSGWVWGGRHEHAQPWGRDSPGASRICPTIPARKTHQGSPGQPQSIDVGQEPAGGPSSAEPRAGQGCGEDQDQLCCSIAAGAGTDSPRGLRWGCRRGHSELWASLGTTQRVLLPVRSVLTSCRHLGSAKDQPGSTQAGQSQRQWPGLNEKPNCKATWRRQSKSGIKLESHSKDHSQDQVLWLLD